MLVVLKDWIAVVWKVDTMADEKVDTMVFPLAEKKVAKKADETVVEREYCLVDLMDLRWAVSLVVMLVDWTVDCLVALKVVEMDMTWVESLADMTGSTKERWRVSKWVALRAV